MSADRTHWFVKAMDGDLNLVEALNTPAVVLQEIQVLSLMEFPVSGDLNDRFRAKEAVAPGGAGVGTSESIERGNKSLGHVEEKPPAVAAAEGDETKHSNGK